MSKELPLVYMIARPREIPKGRGIHATNGPNARLIQSRGTMQEWRRIQVAAELHGLSASMWMRRILCDMADQVIDEATKLGIDVEAVAKKYQ